MKGFNHQNCYGDEATIVVLDKTNYPRTGKRGVPQQFPRKLYDMLEAESKDDIVHWSSSGRAFRIADVSRFSKEVLSKYFKTSKFSSFQRNLNLYGFTKIRKGPDIDMYSHPGGFIRGEEDGLSQLRKRTKAPVKKKRALSSFPPHSHATHPTGFSLDFEESFRVISPTISTCASTVSCTEHCHNVPSQTLTHSLRGPLQRKLNSERLTMLADAMVMLIEK
mmetsp:Transcript_10682/g.23638  ORF Transcript_10682/g.23638 Transcript_10682/m.23638 type:complete len:221 (-) Transcript_10682:49-711(-)|eukprot:CAMPEP_0172325468 /NCGR_PEP_ID=MMETSP1058-20130122/54126_1 /TAXON_ID=83371 /ORGANISM="Detonula confervacea, Strain CCMP 353" /LENGTH=220 /DNA_ID=CAMNT_0013042019 /DNA_START=117 /DNA_END=782 /DNA_ORIENTATION=+